MYGRWGDDVLVRVRASSLNQGDLDYLYGRPFLTRIGTGLRRPKNAGLGFDVAGQVEAVGKKVTKFRPGDEVFADLTEFGWGAFGRVRVRSGARVGTQAGRSDLGGGSDLAAGGGPGPAGPPRRERDRTGRPSAGQRCVGKRGPLRRTARQAPSVDERSRRRLTCPSLTRALWSA